VLYVPNHFREADLSRLHDTIAGAGLATLVTQGDAGPIVSHLPMLLDRTDGEKGALIGHLARGNPQWKASDLGKPALAIFLGPDAYISPNYYATKKTEPRVVPTWNYVAIHVQGRLETFEDSDRLLDVVTRLTDEHERRAGTSWKATDAPADYLDKMLKAIVGVKIAIESIEGKFKLGQNRATADRESVVAALSTSDDTRRQDVAALTKKTL
jgi:transcriptional regulator